MNFPDKSKELSRSGSLAFISAFFLPEAVGPTPTRGVLNPGIDSDPDLGFHPFRTFYD